MIDIHSHILWEIDDGARSLDESIEMCQISAQDGVSLMVATPHAFDGVHKTHERATLQQKVKQLNGLLGGHPGIELGCELRFTHDVIRQVCIDKTAPSIAAGPYVLIEFPHYAVPVGSERVLFELISNQMWPIIAHPERNQVLMSEPERFYALVEMGAFGQVDVGSITGQFGKKVQQASRTMLEHGLIHVVASDCHNTRNRLPGMSVAVGSISSLVGEDAALKMARDNPAAIVEGKPLPWLPAPVFPKKKRRKWFFFRAD